MEIAIALGAIAIVVVVSLVVALLAVRRHQRFTVRATFEVERVDELHRREGGEDP